MILFTLYQSLLERQPNGSDTDAASREKAPEFAHTSFPLHLCHRSSDSKDVLFRQRRLSVYLWEQSFSEAPKLTFQRRHPTRLRFLHGHPLHELPILESCPTQAEPEFSDHSK